MRRNVAVVIRPATSPGELARAFELIGALRPAALEQDRYFLQVARGFPEDRSAPRTWWCSKDTSGSPWGSKRHSAS